MSSRTSFITAIAVAGIVTSVHIVATSSDLQAPLAATAITIRLPAGTQLNRGAMGPMRTELAISPDGRLLVFSATPDGTMEHAALYRQPLNGGEATAVAATEGACMPAFSPDGRAVAYWAGGKLFKVGATSGAPVAICDLPAMPVGISWGPDGKIVFGTQGSKGGLRRVAAEGGSPEPLTKVDTGREATHRLPHVLPGGKAVLFTVMPYQAGVDAWVETVSLETGQRTVLIRDAADARYVPTGHLVFVRRGTLMAVPFSPDHPGAIGETPKSLLGVAQAFNVPLIPMNSGAGLFDSSESGALAFVPGGMYPDFPAYLNWVDRGGRSEEWKAFGARQVQGLRLSPDGTRVAMSLGGLNYGLWVYDIPKNRMTRLATGGQVNAPFWTPDGKRITFAWAKQDLANIWSVAAEGGGQPEPIVTSETDQRGNSWSPDGRYLAFVETKPGTGTDVMVLNVADKRVSAFAASKANESQADFSRDGRWLAYVSNESGRNEVYLRSFPDGRRTLQVSVDGGTSPIWGPDGRELFYWDLAFKQMMRARISPGENLSAEPASLLFSSVGPGPSLVRIYSITGDGKRFLVRPQRTPQLPPITELKILPSWFADLRRISPPGK